MAAYCQDNGNTKKDWTPICLYAMRTYSLSVIHRRMPIGTKMHHRRCACPQLSFVLCGWVTPHHKPTHKPHHKYQLTRKLTRKVTHKVIHKPTYINLQCVQELASVHKFVNMNRFLNILPFDDAKNRRFCYFFELHLEITKINCIFVPKLVLKQVP